MTTELLAALIVFSFVSSITPGPNNLMLLASGVNFGFSRTIPHLAGICVGFTLMVALVGLGLGGLFKLYPALLTVLKYAGAFYMLWLAYHLACSGPIAEGERRGRPMSFLQAAAFQWVNPKAWVMAVYANATYTQNQNYLTGVLIVTLVFGIVNGPCISSWALFGAGMKRFLADARTMRLFNIAMALLLVASLWPIFSEAS
jgi:threonine/homoserine/homoserine lactone efflux protein